jgi:hypothetical protein
VRALLASPYGPYAAGLLCLAAVATGVYLGAAWDRASAAARHYYAPGRRRR